MPGLCHKQCDLVGTIKIVEGATWKPELLDHNTAEWKNLAREVEAQVNESHVAEEYGIISMSDLLTNYMLFPVEQCLQQSRSIEQMVPQRSDRQFQQRKRVGRLHC